MTILFPPLMCSQTGDTRGLVFSRIFNCEHSAGQLPLIVFGYDSDLNVSALFEFHIIAVFIN